MGSVPFPSPQLGWIWRQSFGHDFVFLDLILAVLISRWHAVALTVLTFRKNKIVQTSLSVSTFCSSLTGLFLVGCRETWSQEQCRFSGQYHGSKSESLDVDLRSERLHFPVLVLHARSVDIDGVHVHACVCMYTYACPMLAPFVCLCVHTCPSMPICSSYRRVLCVIM